MLLYVPYIDIIAARESSFTLSRQQNGLQILLGLSTCLIIF